jgi:hypothetical protein
LDWKDESGRLGADIFALVVAFPAHGISMLVAGLGAGVVRAVVCELHIWMGD